MTIVYFKKYAKEDHEISYTKSYSRPSRSLIDPDLYNKFKAIKVDPFDKLKEYTLKECISYYIDDFKIHSDYVIIKEDRYLCILDKGIYDIYNKSLYIYISRIG